MVIGVAMGMLLFWASGNLKFRVHFLLMVGLGVSAPDFFS